MSDSIAVHPTRPGWDARLFSVVLLVVYWLMVGGYFPSNGLYSTQGALLVGAAWLLLAAVFVALRVGWPRLSLPARALNAALGLSLVGTVGLAYWRYGVNIHSWYGFQDLLWRDIADALRLAVLAVTCTYLVPRTLPVHFDWLRFGLVLGLFFALKLVFLGGMPKPRIDLFVMNQRACQFLMEGHNPYTRLPYLEAVPDIPGNLPEGQYTNVYPPGVLLGNLPFWLLCGDVRYVYPFLDVVLIVLWMSLAAPRSGLWAAPPSFAAQCLILMYLLSPQGSFMTFQGWTDPMITTWLSLIVWLFTRGRYGGAFLALGAALATKLQALPFLMGALRLRRPTLAQAALAALGFLGLCLPFIWGNGEEFVRHMTLALRMGPRPDALTLVNLCGLPVSGIVRTGMLVVIGAWFLQGRSLVDYLAGTTFYLLTLFYFGKWAFVNYYWLVGSVLLLTVLVASTPPPAGPDQQPEDSQQG